MTYINLWFEKALLSLHRKGNHLSFLWITSGLPSWVSGPVFSRVATNATCSLGLIRKPAAFISTISDERGQELLYAGMRITDVFKEDIGLGGVVSLLWFKYGVVSISFGGIVTDFAFS